MIADYNGRGLTRQIRRSSPSARKYGDIAMPLFFRSDDETLGSDGQADAGLVVATVAIVACAIGLWFLIALLLWAAWALRT